MKKINSLQLLGSVIDNYSMESFFDYYVDIQIQREKEDLYRMFLYEQKAYYEECAMIDEGFFDDYEPEYYDEEYLLNKYGFDQ